MIQETLTPTTNIIDIVRLADLLPENAIELYTKEIEKLNPDSSDWQRAFTLYMNRAVAYTKIGDYANYKADLDKALVVNTREVAEDQKIRQAKNTVSVNTNLVQYHLTELKNPTNGEVVKKKDIISANEVRVKAEKVLAQSLKNADEHLDVLIPYHLQSAMMFWEAAVSQNNEPAHFKEATNHLLEAQSEVKAYIQANPTEYWAYMLHTRVLEAILFLVPKLPAGEAQRFPTPSFTEVQELLLTIARHNVGVASMHPTQVIETKIA